MDDGEDDDRPATQPATGVPPTNRAQVEEQARQALRAFLRLAWGRRRHDPQVDEFTSLLISDPRIWVTAGIAKPGPCMLTYPRSLLEQAYEGATGLPDFLSDLDCGHSLLSDDESPLPNHLCPDTIFATTRKYARREYPPRNAAQRLWVREWPFPVGTRSILFPIYSGNGWWKPVR